MTEREPADTNSARRITWPCVGICEIDSQSGYFRGCLRTLEEIAGWLKYFWPRAG
jgi:predicted Fe-S protein YdhL (DUF1289 family)